MRILNDTRLSLSDLEIDYIGIDPGKVTAVAIMGVDDTIVHHVGDPMEMCDVVYDYLYSSTGALHWVIGMERYTMGSSVRTHQPDALEVIGAVKWMCRAMTAHTSIRMQGAADAAKTGSRENLVKAGWWIPADPDQHRNKAAAQVAHAMLQVQPHRWHNIVMESDKR